MIPALQTAVGLDNGFEEISHRPVRAYAPLSVGLLPTHQRSLGFEAGDG